MPNLPFGGWAAGSSLLFSGAVVLGLLGYSYREQRATEAADRRLDQTR